MIKRVLLTRPKPAGKELGELLNQNQIPFIKFPTIEIKPINVSDSVTREHLHQAKLIIFTSRNAVYYGAHLLGTPRGNIVAIGSGTAQALEEQGLSVDLVPKAFNSESLLEDEALQRVRSQHIVIVKGEGGRDLLLTTLMTRGAIVHPIHVYKRALPEARLTAEQLSQIQIILATSCEMLVNLCQMTPHYLQAKLKNKQLLITSPRIREKAEKLGFTPPFLQAENARNESIIKALFGRH